MFQRIRQHKGRARGALRLAAVAGLALGLAGAASMPRRLNAQPASTTFLTVNQCATDPSGPVIFPWWNGGTGAPGSGDAITSLSCATSTYPNAVPVEGWPVTVTATGNTAGFAFSNGQLSISGYTNDQGNFTVDYTNTTSASITFTAAYAPEGVFTTATTIAQTESMLPPLAPTTTTTTTAPAPVLATVGYDYPIGTITAQVNLSCVGSNWTPPEWPTEIPTNCIASTSPNWDSVVNQIAQALANNQSPPTTVESFTPAPTSSGGGAARYTPAVTTATSTTTSSTTTTDPRLAVHAKASPTGGSSGSAASHTPVDLVNGSGGGVPVHKVSTSLTSASVGGALAGTAAAGVAVFLVGRVTRRRKRERSAA